MSWTFLLHGMEGTVLWINIFIIIIKRNYICAKIHPAQPPPYPGYLQPYPVPVPVRGTPAPAPPVLSACKVFRYFCKCISYTKHKFRKKRLYRVSNIILDLKFLTKNVTLEDFFNICKWCKWIVNTMIIHYK